MNEIEKSIVNAKRAIDRLSKDYNAPNDPADAAIDLLSSYPRHAVIEACKALIDDPTWSFDRQPYGWVEGILDFAINQ